MSELSRTRASCGVAVAFALSLASPAAAELTIVNISPAFPTGPYTTLNADTKDIRRLAVGTASGKVAWSDDAGRSANESTVLVARDFDASGSRGVGPRSSLRAWRSRTERSSRLFSAIQSKGLKGPRWAMWMALGDSVTQVTGVALPAENGRMILSAANGVYVSDVHRTMWTRSLGDAAPMARAKDLVATSVAISPVNPKIMLAGTTNGLYVSRDGGFTFSAHRQPEVSDTIVGLVWDATRPEMVLAITGQGVLQSSDNGGRFEAAFVNDDVRDISLTNEGALVATGSGVVVLGESGERTLLSGQAIVGAVPWDDGVTLVATPTSLLALGPDGSSRIELMHATERDPFIRLVGRAPLAYALTSSGVFRIGPAETRAPAKAAPRLRLTLPELERVVISKFGEPADARADDRWYARLLPRVVVEVTGYVDRSDMIMFDGTFPGSYRRASASSSANTYWVVFATWDLSQVLFGDSNPTNPGSSVGSGLRGGRDRMSMELRSRYREASVLAKQLERPPADPLVEINWRLRLEELAAYLEALAGRPVVDLSTNEPPNER